MRKVTVTEMLILSGEAYQNFAGAINNKATRETYDRWLQVAARHFKEQYNIQSLDELVKVEPKQLEKMVISLFNAKKQEDLSYSYINGSKSALKLFLVQNDVVLNWDKLVKYLPEQKRLVEDRAYTKAEIQNALKVMDLRNKVIILTLESTGMRIGALTTLKLKHVHRIDRLYKFKVYSGTREQYTTFCTPECAEAIDLYLADRKAAGEEVTPESPLIRDAYSRLMVRHPEKQKHGSHVCIETLRGRVLYNLEHAGIRKPKSKINRRAEGRHEVMIMHGLRKYFNTQLARAKVDKVVKEMLMGHKTGLEASYLRLDESELLAEYTKAIPLLSIQDIVVQAQEIEDLKYKLRQNNDTQALLEQMGKDFALMKEQMTAMLMNSGQARSVEQAHQILKRETGKFLEREAL